MTKHKKESFFWTSYSDLTTSLFFVMLVLFVLVIVLLHNKMMEIEKERQLAEKERKATQEQLDKITEINESVKNIDTTYFEYDSEFKRHTLKNIKVSFRKGSSNINDIPAEQLESLLEVGKSIIQFVATAVAKNQEVKYLLIIEGQSSKDNYIRNYELSYERALALVKYWIDEKNLKFDHEKCEIIISGSGQESPFREKPDIPTNFNNQRFVIHIIPKIGEIKKASNNQ
jgi:flagellar motor protein MotB